MLLNSRLKPYNLYRFEQVTDAEGGKYEGYAKTPVTVRVEIWPASGGLQAQMYGERLAYMLNLNAELSEDIREKDGLRVYATGDKPDYRVKSIKRYTLHQVAELEAIR